MSFPTTTFMHFQHQNCHLEFGVELEAAAEGYNHMLQLESAYMKLVAK